MCASSNFPNRPAPWQETHSPAYQRSGWSPKEKGIARKAFDLALQREFAQVIQEARKRAADLEEPEDLWKLEEFLTRSRKRIDGQYDYRYSVLPMVLGTLVRQGRLSESELEGLGEDKLQTVRMVTRL